jgi:hypothetical protein
VAIAAKTSAPNSSNPPSSKCLPKATSSKRKPSLLFCIGLDSLLAVELRNTLGTELGQPLSATLLFDYPTIDALTDFILDEVLALEEPAVSKPKGATAAPASLVDSIEDLSDDEVERTLAARAKRAS